MSMYKLFYYSADLFFGTILPLLSSVPGVELFDLSTDPGATHDLDTERPAQLAELRQLLADHRADLERSSGPRRSVYMDASTKQNLGDLGYL